LAHKAMGRINGGASGDVGGRDLVGLDHRTEPALFYGAFLVFLLAAAWLWIRGRRALAERHVGWVVAGFLLIVLPYILYGVRYHGDLAGQVEFTKAGCFQFEQPEFYFYNLRREPDRLARLLLRPVPTLTAYAIVLLPSICITLAVLTRDTLSWAWQEQRSPAARLAVGGMIIALLVTAAAEGRAAYRVDLRQAEEVSDYLQVGRQIDAYLAPGAVVVGADRWWWALHAHPYLAFNNLRTQWLMSEQNGQRAFTFADQVRQAGVEFIVVSKDVRGVVALSPAEFGSQFQRFLRMCTVQLGGWRDRTYDRIEVYQVMTGCSLERTRPISRPSQPPGSSDRRADHTSCQGALRLEL
jgi:hypothetical protein